MQRRAFRTWLLGILGQKNGPSVTQIVLRAIGTLFGLQVLIVAILQLVSKLRCKEQQGGSFLRPNLNDVRVGDNTLQLYDEKCLLHRF